MPGPYSASDDEGNVIATGKRNEVAEITKARAAALQASGVSAMVEEVDEQGRVLHTFPFYSDGATSQPPVDESPSGSSVDDEADTAETEFL